jgi:transposase InsO family protein
MGAAPRTSTSVQRKTTTGVVAKLSGKRHRPAGKLLNHSDQGRQYASRGNQQLRPDHGIQPSESTKGSCYDNALGSKFIGFGTFFICSGLLRALAKILFFQFGAER